MNRKGKWAGRECTAEDRPKTMTTTIDTVTDEQIGELAAEAQRAGDDEQVHLCEIALGCGSGVAASDQEMRRARQACADAIAAAEAMAHGS